MIESLFNKEVFESLNDGTLESLLIAERVWPALGLALEALTLQVEEQRLSNSGEWPLSSSSLKFLATHLINFGDSKVQKSSHCDPTISNLTDKHACPGWLSIWRDWCDLERGSILWRAKTETIKRCFDGFTVRRLLRKSDIVSVYTSIDDSLSLGVELIELCRKSEKEFPDFLDWDYFSSWISNLGIRGGMMQRGLAREEDLSRKRFAEAEDERKMREIEEKIAHEAESRARNFQVAVSSLLSDPMVSEILESGKILTGVVQDATERELPVRGCHVSEIWKFVQFMGFNLVTADGGLLPIPTPPRWSYGMNRCWAAIQRSLGMSVQDGVVDRESLRKLAEIAGSSENLPSEQILDFLARVLIDWKDHVQSQEGEEDTNFSFPGRCAISFSGIEVPPPAPGKPSLDRLCRLFGISRLRLDWLHDQFKALLAGGHDGYPEDPNALSRDQVKQLIDGLQPDITADEFELKFNQIDQDGSGQIEFDEFVEWMTLDKIEVENN